MGATKIMVIRHAERPGTYSGTRYDGVNAAGDVSGANGRKHLITRGWQRAGALVTLFTPPWGPKPGLATPAHLFASAPENGDDTDQTGPSQRPYETLTAIAAKLDREIDTNHKKDHYDKMVTKALEKEGTVLIAWQHEDIPLRNKEGRAGMSQAILDQTQTPPQKFNIPLEWPKGSEGARYDLVFVFDRPRGEGPIEKFSLVGQMLLAGDAPAS
jgi:hypothetical protein